MGRPFEATALEQRAKTRHIIYEYIMICVVTFAAALYTFNYVAGFFHIYFTVCIRIVTEHNVRNKCALRRYTVKIV